MSVAAPCPDLTSAFEQPLSVAGARSTRRWLTIVAAATLVGSIAAFSRLLSLGATFESSDQGAMAHLIHHGLGVRWMFAHAYGPTLPLLGRASSLLFGLLHIPSSEVTCRLPVALVSLAQVAITYPFMRRLGATAREALCATLCVALLPTLVSDAHYAWGYLTVWLFTGTVAIWTTLAWMDTRRWAYLFVAGAALGLHSLSNTFSVGVPVTLLAMWAYGFRRSNQITEADRQRGNSAYRLAAPLIGFVVPCLGALAVIVLSWRWTGGGPLGHLLAKHNNGTILAPLGQLLLAPQLWREQFGYVFGVIAAAGLTWGCVRLTRQRERRLGLLALWALIAGFPLAFLTNWEALHYPGSYLGSYFIEVIYCAGLLGGVLMWRVLERASTRPVPRLAGVALIGAILLALGAGSVDQIFNAGRFAAYTGVNARWGMVRPDSGIKAAGAYVRANVPTNCLILCLHNNKGMELPLAEYYTGRRTLSDFDLKPAMYPAILASVGPRVDVIIAEGSEAVQLDQLAEFQRACTIWRGIVPVRIVYARRARGLPSMDVDVAELNELYDREFRSDRVPVATVAPPGFDAAYQTYKATLKELRRAPRTAVAWGR